MKIRTVSGACFVLLTAAFFLLRQFVDYRFFSIYIWFFCAMGTFEVSRALKSNLKPSVFIALIVYGVLFVPVYAVFEYFVWGGFGWLVAVAFTVVYSAALISVQGGAESPRASFIALVPLLYPSVLLLTMLQINSLELGFVALLLVFVISPCADTFAYLVGMTYSKIRKGNVKKLCPALSPNKTVAGAIGGVIGGTIGALVLFFICKPEINSSVPALIFIIIGFFGSIFTEAGDLFESFIKRRAGIKDMGRIMPGHGGVMDRIDGMVFASALIYFIFLFL